MWRRASSRLAGAVGTVVLDVDGTLTTRDTLEDIVMAAIEGHNRLARDADSGTVSERKRQQWQELKGVYGGAYRAFCNRLHERAAEGVGYEELEKLFIEEERMV